MQNRKKMQAEKGKASLEGVGHGENPVKGRKPCLRHNRAIENGAIIGRLGPAQQTLQRV